MEHSEISKCAKEWQQISFSEAKVLVTQLCLTLGDPMDCGLQGSSVHGILQARILEWVAIPFFRGSSWPRDEPGSPASQADFLPSEPKRKTFLYWTYPHLFNPLPNDKELLFWGVNLKAKQKISCKKILNVKWLLYLNINILFQITYLSLGFAFSSGGGGNSFEAGICLEISFSAYIKQKLHWHSTSKLTFWIAEAFFNILG